MKEREHLGNINVDGRIILKLELNNYALYVGGGSGLN
jgi:hypothetical protein